MYQHRSIFRMTIVELEYDVRNSVVVYILFIINLFLDIRHRISVILCMVSDFILILSLSSESVHTETECILYGVEIVSKYKCCLFVTRGNDKSRNLIVFIIESLK